MKSSESSESLLLESLESSEEPEESSKSFESSEETDSPKPTKLSKPANLSKPSKPPKQRYYKLIDPATGEACGRYAGQTPKHAASKAFTNLVKKEKYESNNDNDSDQTIKFEIQECTRGSSHRIHSYEGKRTKLANPITLQIGHGDNTKTISIITKIKLKKLKNMKLIVKLVMME